MVRQSSYCRSYSLQYKLHKNRTVHILSFFPPLTLPLPFFYLPAVYQITLHTTRGQSRTFLSPFPARMYAIISSPRRNSLSHTHSQAGYVSLKTTLTFRFRVQMFLPDWKRREFYAHLYSGYMEQETLSSHVSSFHFGSITTALRGSLHYTPIRRWVAVNGYNHSENRPATPDLHLTAYFNNPDISRCGVNVPL